jgi:hypothetical protein
MILNLSSEQLNGFTCTEKPWHLDYLHMNRFFTLNMFRHPALSPFEYYVRLDTDLFVKESIPFDIFRRMKDEGAVFAYWNEHREPDGCVYGLQDAVMKFMRDKEIPIYRVDSTVLLTFSICTFLFADLLSQKAYHGCFGAGKLSFFRSSQYLEFADYLNELGGIYTHRSTFVVT